MSLPSQFTGRPSRRLTTVSWIMGAGFLISALVRFTVNPSGAHTWRQSDTLGMSMGFALDVRQGNWLSGARYLWEPKLLQRGVQDGVNPSEFPLLNVLCGPLFLAGPQAGSFLSSCFVMLLAALGALWILPRYFARMGAPVARSWCLLMWMGCGTVCRQSGPFMPEMLGFVLTLGGMTLLLETNLSAWAWAAGVLMGNLGILVKPTMVVMLIPTAVAVVLEARDERRLARLGGLAAMLALPAGWYGWYVARLRLPPHGPTIYPKADFAPLKKLRDFGVRGMALSLFRETCVEQFPAYTGFLFMGLAAWKASRRILLSYMLALLGAMALDGKHILMHEYYFIGAALSAMWLMAGLIYGTRSARLLNFFLAAFICGGLLQIRYNIWAFAHTPYLWDLGRASAGKIPRDAMLVTDDGPYPQKLLWVGRIGIIGLRTLKPVCQPAFYPDRKIAVLVDESSIPQLTGNACGQPVEKFRNADHSWALFLRSKLSAERQFNSR